ncbi:MAG: HD domain-containing protein [Planctomycetes bacterium]|nr:HD domain-containing protein [Planctomycetota bacterium]
MNAILPKHRRTYELMLIIVILGTTTLFAQMGAHQVVVLNLFYLPIILGAYFLGRSSAGVLALLCALSVTIATTLSPTGFAAFDTAIMVGLALTLWAAVLGLVAILLGTLCDARAATLSELHTAYVGVVEVLSKYLQGGNPRLKTRSIRVAELSQQVAEALKLPQKDIDDVRVAALLHDLGNLEITTQVLSQAVDTLEADPPQSRRHTFLGTDLVQSLGGVLEGALPLLVNQDDAVRDYLVREEQTRSTEMPLGARIVRIARRYDDLVHDPAIAPAEAPQYALNELRRESDAISAVVLNALERVRCRPQPTLEPEPVHA